MPPIRVLTTADVPDCLALTEEHGWTFTAARWTFLIEAGEVFGVDAPDGGLAGVVLLTRYEPKLAAIGTMLVASRFGRQGLGTTLMRHALEQAGDATVFLYATSFGRPLYQKLGFRTVGTAGTLTGTPRPEDTAERTRPAEPADLEAILRLDAEVFGADRGHLVRRLPGFASRLRVLERGDRITGYAAAVPANDRTSLGPLVAPDDAGARALINDLARDVDGPIRVDPDHGRTELVAWLIARGLTEATSNTIMVFGERPLPGDRDRLYLPMMTALG
jgi:predicted N-acetyltransferase YhbS